MVSGAGKRATELISAARQGGVIRLLRRLPAAELALDLGDDLVDSRVMQLAEVGVQAGAGVGPAHDQRVSVLLLGLLHLGQLGLDVGWVERKPERLGRNGRLVVLEGQRPRSDSVL